MRKLVRCIDALSLRTAALEREIAALRNQVAQFKPTVVVQQLPAAEKKPGIARRLLNRFSCRHARLS